MSLWSRLLMLLRIKSAAALDRAEDPRETLDFAYAQQTELLRKVRQGLIDVSASKQQLEQQESKLRAKVPQLEEQARRALSLEREDLARLALTRKQAALTEVEGLAPQIAEVAAEERRLLQAEQQLAARIEEFRTHREVVSARYTAAGASARVSEALTGVSGEFAELSMAVGRAEEKTARLQARASAIDRLLESGDLAVPMGPMGTGNDTIEQELRRLSTGAS